ncbi:MAG TPA: hypothetical protein VF939_11450 [Puia sp.]
MSTYSGQGRPHYILLVLLAIAILLDRYLIAGLFPWAPGLAGVNPMLVFLDIPVPLPVIIDLPVIGLFFFFYWILLLSYPSRYGAATWRELRKRLWSLFTGAFAILLCLAAGGGIYYLSSGLMSRQVRNGIDSFGIQADIYTPIPDHEIIHLRGGMILLVCFFIGLRIFLKRTERIGAMMEPGIAGSRTPGAPEFSGKVIDPGKIVDPRIAGFQEKERRTGERGASGLPDAAVMGARTAATSVPVVAPLPVNLLSEGMEEPAGFSR